MHWHSHPQLHASHTHVLFVVPEGVSARARLQIQIGWVSATSSSSPPHPHAPAMADAIERRLQRAVLEYVRGLSGDTDAAVGALTSLFSATAANAAPIAPRTLVDVFTAGMGGPEAAAGPQRVEGALLLRAVLQVLATRSAQRVPRATCLARARCAAAPAASTLRARVGQHVRTQRLLREGAHGGRCAAPRAKPPLLVPAPAPTHNPHHTTHRTRPPRRRPPVPEAAGDGDGQGLFCGHRARQRCV